MSETVGLIVVFALGAIVGTTIVVVLGCIGDVIERRVLLHQMRRDFVRMKETDEWKQTFITMPEKETK